MRRRHSRNINGPLSPAAVLASWELLLLWVRQFWAANLMMSSLGVESIITFGLDLSSLWDLPVLNDFLSAIVLPTQNFLRRGIHVDPCI